MKKRATLHFQKGAATTVALFFIIVVISLFLVTAMKMTSQNNAEISEHADGMEALFLAESALERIQTRLNTGTACTFLGVGKAVDNVAYSLGRGTFQILTTSLPVPTRCSATVVGTITVGAVSTQRRIAADFEQVTSVLEQFPNFTGWTTVLDPTFNQGTISLNGGLWWQAKTNGQGSVNSHLKGYSWKTIPVISTGATPRVINVSLDFAKFTQGGATSQIYNLGVELYDPTTLTATSLWQDTSLLSGATALTPTGTLAATLPANKNYNQLRITFDFFEAGRKVMTGYIDNILITSKWSLANWQEVDQ